jgi:hypothetical protein
MNHACARPDIDAIGSGEYITHGSDKRPYNASKELLPVELFANLCLDLVDMQAESLFFARRAMLHF